MECRFELGMVALPKADGEFGKPAFDLIDPGRRSRGEIDVEMRMTGNPISGLWRLVRAVVVHQLMDVEIGQNVGFDSAEKGQKPTAAVAPVQLPDDLAGGDIERSKQRRCAVTYKSCAGRSGSPGTSGSIGWVRSSACIWLFSSTHNTIAFTRWQIQPDDVADLVDKQRIGRELECTSAGDFSASQ